jgi:cyanophycinase
MPSYPYRGRVAVAALLAAVVASVSIAASSASVGSANTAVGPAKGSLVIVGGAMRDPAILKRFMELAGGPDAPLVIIPTAGEDDHYDLSWSGVGQFRDVGFANITVLHTRDPKVADTESFVEPIRKARAVFFGGGRQWRLADSYLNTLTHRELDALLDRGGVIGGTSAGATIQGSYLVRGDTSGNEIMMGDHIEGLAFLRNVAIDQHLLRRNRQFDLVEVIETFPGLLGIGIDEDTAIVVKGDEFEVMGRGYVAIYDRHRQIPPSGRFYLLAPGDRYDMRARKGTRPGQRGAVPIERVRETPWPVATPAPAGRSATPAPAQASPLSPATIEALDRFVATEHAKDGIGSLTVGVVSKDGLLWAKSYGYADQERRIHATSDTVYRIGSITKQFTALMLLQLVEQGKVKLSDPVEKYFPEIRKVTSRRPEAPPVTLGQLATMTAGLAREPDGLPAFLKGPVADWEKTTVSALDQTKFEFEPDTRYHYSNIGYAVLGAALGRAAGQPFVEYVNARILAPLGMTSSAFEPDAAILARLSKGYAVSKAGVDADTPAREHAGRGYKVPNGALYTTIGDLARFVAFQLGAGPESVLPLPALEDNFSRVSSASGNLSSGYGIGFQVTRRGTRVVYGHGGSVAGYNAAAHFDRQSGFGVIVLRNAGGGQVTVGSVSMRMLDMLAAAGTS